jgi:FkbM family methyltransferase
MNTAHEEAMRGLSPLHRFLFNLRPAWLASWLKRVLGIKRAVMETEAGRFYADPVSHFYAYSRVPGGYEPLLTSCIKSMLQPGDTFLDIGANESYFSILASSLVGPEGLVVAVEPQQRLNAVIQRNICENSAHNILSLRYAISDTDGKSEFFLAPDINTGYSGLFRTAKYNLPTEIVPTITLERLVKMLSLKKVKLMKLDVESYEYEVILGSKPVFESDLIENIVLELHPSVLEQRGKRVDDIEEFLLSAGYRKDNEFGKVGAGHRDGMLFRKQG